MRYHKTDAWRGFAIPEFAVAGASDTGTYSDSPCPSPKVAAELYRVGREVLHPASIKYRTRFTSSSNVFCMKRWVTVRGKDWARAIKLVDAWLVKHKQDTQFIHDAR